MSRNRSLVVAIAWAAVIWLVREHLPGDVWIFFFVLAVVWISRAGERVLSGLVGAQRAGPVTVYVHGWGERPEEVVQAARRLGCELHPRVLERKGPTEVAVAIRVSEGTAAALAESLRTLGADVLVCWRGRDDPPSPDFVAGKRGEET
ncbi:hypothetical protein H4N58_17130 [Mumia sp. ZJ1417]|uniref:hypothetical protein n=1 Tax=Mumia sp. ZJ1417 TaxID=2708082 RepID=UPI00142127D0|nr:hypothetical protein [Mumia sp. ZJ1417]QMW65862.1 hypothetical protein H4N58_17130 [Mumia sp. ZJ1417]